VCIPSWVTVQDVDEKLLYDTFSAFGIIANNPKVSIMYAQAKLPRCHRAVYWV